MASKFETISVPEIYKTSADFRFFLKWFESCLTKTEYDTENLDDLYDPLRCPSDLLWMLADTMGFKYDDRLPVAFNRLVLVYFMSMIRNKGSKDGVTLAAEANLAQFNIINYGKTKDILYSRLEDTSIPVNSVYVTPHTPEGYIDVVYFSEEIPIDACIEYVRPLGMYLAQAAGVRYDARTKISIDPRLTDTANIGMSIGPTRVGHYSREDYARMQLVDETELESGTYLDDKRNTYQYDPTGGQTRRQAYQTQKSEAYKLAHKRQPAWYRNSEYEQILYGDDPSITDAEKKTIDANYRALYSLQMSNNEHIFNSLIPGLSEEESEKLNAMSRIFGLGYNPQDASYMFDGDYLHDEGNDEVEYEYSHGASYKNWNLRYDLDTDSEYGGDIQSLQDVYTIEEQTYQPQTVPAVNPVMGAIGDSMSMNHTNNQYLMSDKKVHPVTNKHVDMNEVVDPADVETDWKPVED